MVRFWRFILQLILYSHGLFCHQALEAARSSSCLDLGALSNFLQLLLLKDLPHAVMLPAFLYLERESWLSFSLKPHPCPFSTVLPYVFPSIQQPSSVPIKVYDPIFTSQPSIPQAPYEVSLLFNLSVSTIFPVPKFTAQVSLFQAWQVSIPSLKTRKSFGGEAASFLPAPRIRLKKEVDLL